jgi:hypothetical protein
MSIGRRTRERADVPKSVGGGLWRLCKTESRHGDDKHSQNTQFLDLFVEDSQLNVYAGEPEVRPPGAPTSQSLPRGSTGFLAPDTTNGSRRSWAASRPGIDRTQRNITFALA